MLDGDQPYFIFEFTTRSRKNPFTYKSSSQRVKFKDHRFEILFCILAKNVRKLRCSLSSSKLKYMVQDNGDIRFP